MDENNYTGTVNPMDSAMWRLVVKIDNCSLKAWLVNSTGPGGTTRMLVNANLKESGMPLLQAIESVVYDNPMLLDDYEADIIIDTTKITFVPSPLSDEEDAVSKIWSAIFDEPEEVEGELHACDLGDVTALFYLTHGLQSFLLRTFPGARVTHPLCIAARWCVRSNQAQGSTMLLQLSDDAVDVVAFTPERFLLACRHDQSCAEDVLYHAANTAAALGFDPDSTAVLLIGTKEQKAPVSALLRKHFNYAASAILPAAIDMSELPIDVSMCLQRQQMQR